MNELSKNIKIARTKKKMSQLELAKAIGKSKNVISNWERGNNKPDVDKIELLCTLLDTTPNKLMGWESPIHIVPAYVTQELIQKDIIKRIKNRRIKLSLSYQDLAKKTGLSKSTLQRYETGTIGNIPLDKLEILAKALCVSPAYIMGWEKDVVNKKPKTIAAHSTVNICEQKHQMEFKDKIKKRRTALNMTMQELAKKIGVSTPTIQRYESGEIKNVRKDKITLLASALDCSPGYLMDWEENINNETSKQNEINTIATHATEDLTKEEQEKVIEYIKFIKSQRK
ncbi:helix-turn-helix domain-containing protein [Vallitalea guaymasensis]|uniref:Helix-turn-helix transcriptional regulator n=1 Tax=Vallitalea guaymasensis TaxID=1185412 RepID=A0A8J8SBC4_9FIRM|nr:helix-turn-helix transcriptional regulator [Vallitalea guaymasensis]QUH28255.1 helix-turn-helix transcriptional regulator [Vallitalea guaymasensis]